METNQNIESTVQLSGGCAKTFLQKIVDLLENSGSEYRLAGDEVEIKECRYCHPGTEKPTNQWKLRLNHSKGVYNCFRCQASGTIADYLNQSQGAAGSPTVPGNTKHKTPPYESIWAAGIVLKAMQYLQRRGLSGEIPSSIRFHAHLEYYDDNRQLVGKFPAMIAKISTVDGSMVGIHRTYLTEDGCKITSLPGHDTMTCKKILGAAKGNAVRLCDKFDDVIALTEGIETGLAVAQATGLPVWACISARGLESVQLPPSIREVYVWADRDASGVGERSAEKLAVRLKSENRKVHILLPNADSSETNRSVDWLDVFNESNKQLKLAFDATVSESKKLSWHDAIHPQYIIQNSWPAPLSEAAYYGLIGKIVKLVLPHTESDPFALFLQIIAAIGNVIGRSAYFKMEDTKHFLNLFVVIVGDTAKSRKGTSLHRMLQILKLASPDWSKENVTFCGFSSGEGVIHATRDPTFKLKKQKGSDIPEMEMTDAGVDDKRLLVIESEFASVIKITSREGNTLSALLRNAWDRGDLGTLTKNSPEKSTGAHISFIGHITLDELRRYMDSTDAVNGFGNRILWGMVKRSKSLPRGGSLKDSDFHELVPEFRSIIEVAKNIEEMTFDDQTWEIWDELYVLLSADRPGLFGSMTARAEPQVLRLSAIYALTDRSQVIRSEHLKAALAIWQYAQDSCAYIFGGYLEDHVAQRILNALKTHPLGQSRTEIRDLFSGKIAAERMDNALEKLRSTGLAISKKEDTAGRPTEKWFYQQTHLH
jgi:hypothetical protein